MIRQVLINLLSFLVICNCEWHLIWHDEFDSDESVTSKWDVENSGGRCQGKITFTHSQLICYDFREPFESQLNCMTNDKRNLRVVNDTLVISAVYRDHVTQPKPIKPFTSAYIYSKQYFLDGKFEVRAALPSGHLLRSQINLYEPNESDNTWVGITIADFKSGSNHLDVGLFETGANFSHLFRVQTISDLHEFNDYAVVKEEQTIKWFFNGAMVHTYNYGGLQQKLVDRLDGEMEVELDLVVGGPGMPDKFTMGQIANWTCPSLIVDYVRVYQRNASTTFNFTLDRTENSAKDICAIARQLGSLNDTNDLSNAKNKVDLILSGSVFVIVFSIIPLVLILIVIIVYLLFRVRKHKTKISKMKRSIRQNVYDDITDEYELEVRDNYDNCDYEYAKYEDTNNREQNYLGIYDESIGANNRYEIANKNRS